MNILVYLITGVVVGTIASKVTRTNSWLGLLVNIIVGAVGAFLADYFINPLLKLGTINDVVTFPTLLIILLGSAAMIWVVKTVHHHETDNRPVLDAAQTNRQG